jgi:HAD superfamily hydrolase (TIGR01549 family)
LARLRRDYRLAVISNADGRILEVLRRAGVAAYFERIIDSGQVGYEKPDRRIFQAALEAMGAAAGESLYVGDIYAVDYRGATGVGMKAVLIDPMGVYREWQVPRVESLAELLEFAKEKL